MPTSQQNEEFQEPPREKIPGISRAHAAALESSDDPSVWIIAGMDHAIVHTVGRRSGNEHKVTLPVWFDANGDRIVVASFSGAPQHPSWYLNLADKAANPEVKVRVMGRQFWADAQILDGDDYTDTWAALTADRAYYDDYQSRCERRIPLVRLVELRPV